MTINISRKGEIMRKLLLLAISLVFVFVSNVLADKYSGPDISGTWAVSMVGAMGDEYFDLFINQFGEDLVVTATHPQLGPMSGTGTLKGNAISFLLRASGPYLAIQIKFTGTVTGTKMSGTKLVEGIPDDEKSPTQKGGAPSDAAGGGGGMEEFANPGPWTAGLKYVSTRYAPGMP